jgi:hypothetical protein
VRSTRRVSSKHGVKNSLTPTRINS